MNISCLSLLRSMAWWGLLGLWAVPAQAQQVLWQAVNPLSPTLAPAYAGQPSPFVQKPAEPEDSEAEEAQRMARLKALQQAEAVLNSPNALIPNLNGVRFTAHLVGPQGPRVLFKSQWVGQNHKIPVPLQISPEANQALALLREHDTQAADTLSNRLQGRLSANSQRVFTIAKINKNIVELQNDKSVFRISLPGAHQ
jgi:hypothetical protein